MKKYKQNLAKVPTVKKALRSASVTQINPEDVSSVNMPSPFLKGVHTTSKKELPPIGDNSSVQMTQSV